MPIVYLGVSFKFFRIFHFKHTLRKDRPISIEQIFYLYSFNFQAMVEEFARKLWCRLKIRDSIENYALLHLPSVQFVRDKQSDVKTLINNNYGKLFPSMLKCVKNLENVPKSNETVGQFAKVWSTLKEFVPQNKSLRLAENQKRVGNALVQLAYAKSAEEGLNLWRDQCLDEEISGLNNETLQYLLYDKMILDIPEYFKQNKEREFAEDYIETERIPLISGESRFLTEKHRECKMVIYFSDHGKIKSLRLNMTTMFPGMPLYEQVHQHCANQSSLWDILSVLKVRNTGLQPPTESCKPRPEDYTNYVKDFSKQYGLASVIQFFIE